MSTRFHGYIARDDHRILTDALIVSDRSMPSSTNYYKFRAGIARSGKVDYFGTFDGSRHALSKDSPWVLIENGTQKLVKGDTVVLDVEVVGSPGDLSGVTVVFGVGNGIAEPARRIEDPYIRTAFDGVTEWVRNTLGAKHWTALALPRRVEHTQTEMYAHDFDTTSTGVSSGTFIDGLVSKTVTGSSLRSTYVMVKVEATFEAQVANDSLEIAVGDGTNDTPYFSSSQTTVGSTSYVSATLAAEVASSTTFTLRYRSLSGTPLVLQQAISILGVPA